MSAHVIHVENTDELRRAVAALVAGLEKGRLRAVAVVAVDAAGGFEPWWGASATLGPHAGSILRGGVAYLAAAMDAAALE